MWYLIPLDTDLTDSLNMIYGQDRKVIIKTIKPYIETMANDDEAQLVLFTALDVIE